jgi:hypothetical protein
MVSKRQTSKMIEKRLRLEAGSSLAAAGLAVLAVKACKFMRM